VCSRLFECSEKLVDFNCWSITRRDAGSVPFRSCQIKNEYCGTKENSVVVPVSSSIIMVSNHIFSSMRKFRICMEPCLNSKAKAIRMVTVHQWELICEASKEYPKRKYLLIIGIKILKCLDFGEFIGCEKRHHERALHKCQPLKVLPETSLDSFCR
jgi:hypothetical protein